jgi:hypothetical protein
MIAPPTIAHPTPQIRPMPTAARMRLSHLVTLPPG